MVETYKTKEEVQGIIIKNYKELPLYNPKSVCRKCGYKDKEAKSSYLESWYGGTYYHPASIIRTCRNCGYKWQEKPLDAEDAKNG